MKKSTAAVLLVLASNVWGASVCPTIEFAELQTYNHAELTKLRSDLLDKFIPGMFGLPPAEFNNCQEQLRRIDRAREVQRVKESIAASPKRE